MHLPGDCCFANYCLFVLLSWVVIMQITDAIKGLVTGFLKGLSTDVWVEVKTETPECIYYFGPFKNRLEAQKACPGYVADLAEEGATGIQTAIKRCNPPALTISREPVEASIR
jgi:hypothetical protein